MRDQEVLSRLVELISQIEAKRRNSRRPVSRMNSDESRAPSDCRAQPVSSAQKIFCHLFGRRDARRTTASPCPRRDVVQTNITEIGVGVVERIINPPSGLPWANRPPGQTDPSTSPAAHASPPKVSLGQFTQKYGKRHACEWIAGLVSHFPSSGNLNTPVNIVRIKILTVQGAVSSVGFPG